MRPVITAERVRELFNYCPDTGILTWRIPNGPKVKVGSEAGCTRSNGYKNVTLGYPHYLVRRSYKLHRIVWLHYYGEWPKHEIDHINGNRGDNRIANLRDILGRINKVFQHGPRKNNRSGFHGVYPTRDKKFGAKIRRGGRAVYLGTFATAELASAAYQSARQTLERETLGNIT